MIKIDDNAPVIARGEIEIQADPDTIWDVLIDINNWPRWNPDIKSASLEGAVAEGSKFRWKARSISITSIFQEVDKPRLLGWTGKTMGIKAVHIWKLEPTEDTTIARTEESWEGPLTRVMKGSAQDMLQKSIDSGLQYLKQEIEKTSP
ncbi:MAG: Polyketide cyclase / dehydrase and lipid transport [Methanobacterium sp. PtaU1.Bin242]|nr:MAG: Polyketide cyclase / dehydrase and lipid transport [Methanobacterium sp. PtaU1.Bin242]